MKVELPVHTTEEGKKKGNCQQLDKDCEASVSVNPEADEDVSDKQHGWFKAKLTAVTKVNPQHLYVASFIINAALLVGKAVAVALTGSLAVLTTVLDGAVDVISGVLLWIINRAVARTNVQHYPKGRRNLEQVAILIVAVVIPMTAIFVIIMSIQTIASLAKQEKLTELNNGSNITCPGSEPPEFGLPAITICSLTIVLKIILYLLCRSVAIPSVQALALDHRNDILASISALAFGIIGDKLWSYADPVGAILISFFVIFTWSSAALDQVRLLTGYRAPSEFINSLTTLIVDHDPRITKVNDVVAVHHGYHCIVDVDISVKNSLTPIETREIKRTLQEKLSGLIEVDSAYLNVDYDQPAYSTHL